MMIAGCYYPPIRGDRARNEHLLQKRCFFGQKHSLTCGYVFFRGGGIDNATLCDALRDGIPRGVSPPILFRASTRSGGILMSRTPDDLREKMAFFREKHPLTCGYAEKSRGERDI